jgi:hypothetical protein
VDAETAALALLAVWQLEGDALGVGALVVGYGGTASLAGLNLLASRAIRHFVVKLDISVKVDRHLPTGGGETRNTGAT